MRADEKVGQYSTWRLTARGTADIRISCVSLLGENPDVLLHLEIDTNSSSMKIASERSANNIGMGVQLSKNRRSYDQGSVFQGHAQLCKQNWG